MSVKKDKAAKRSEQAKKIKKIPISAEDFLRKIGRMYSEYAIEDISCHMEPDFRYNSFWVLEKMTSAAQYVDYITGKIQTLKKENIVIKTSMMHIRDWGKPCLVLEQEPDIKTCLFVERSQNGLIAKMDMMPKGFYKLVP